LIQLKFVKILVSIFLALFIDLPFSHGQSEFAEENSIVYSEDLALKDELILAIDRHTKVNESSISKGRSYAFKDRAVGKATISASLNTFKRILDLVSTEEELNHLLRKHFDSYSIMDPGKPAEALITGYYIPQINVRKEKTPIYRYPLYRKPSSLALSRQFTRKEIDQDNLLSGLGLEIAYTDDLLALFFMHIQGSGILRFASGETLFANNNGTNEKAFYSISRDLIRDGKLDLASKGSMTDKINSYFSSAPSELEPYLYRNDRYVFFKTGKEGPFGLGKYILTPLRSVAADTSIFPPGTIFYITTEIPEIAVDGTLVGWKALKQFFICQDTGIAIKGMHRIDLYFGIGEIARKKAEYMYRKGRITILMLKN
jgi:membrane-bound lytic murein transglycosylase A